MNELRRMDLNLLLTLHALLAEQHVTRAAVRLHKSQPAVSHALAQLRERFQDPLLIRRGAGMVLTPRAQELQAPLTQALQQLNGLLQDPTFNPLNAVRRMRVAMSDYAAHLVLAPLIQRIRAEAPQMDVVVCQASRATMLFQLADGEIDLALGVFPTPSPDIAFETLFQEQFVSLCDASSLPATGELSLAQWLNRPHVLVATQADAPNEIDTALAALGLRRRIALVLPHWQVATDMLMGTDLLLTMASRAIGAKAHPSLARFAPPFALPTFAFQQAWHVRRQTDAAHRWFRSVVMDSSQP